MKGLALSEKFYRDVASELIIDYFPMIQNKYAAGLIGYGSDVLGHDDELSRDHEWGPRFIIWLTNDDYNRYASLIDRNLNVLLPNDFMGFHTKYEVDSSMHCLIPDDKGKNGIHHIAITTVSKHLKIHFGIDSSDIDFIDWLCIPEQKLLEFTRGKIFYDSTGEISSLRKKLAYFPDSIWVYKMMYAWENLNQIDVIRLCAYRGDILSARITLAKVIERIIRLVYLLNRKYCPGTMKWLSKEFISLPKLAGEISDILDKCLVLEDISKACNYIEEIFLHLIEEHNKLNITKKLTTAPTSQLLRNMTSISFNNIINELQKLLPKELLTIQINGGCDQWVTNDDILIWPEYFSRFKNFYKDTYSIDRSGIGDRML